MLYIAFFIWPVLIKSICSNVMIPGRYLNEVVNLLPLGQRGTPRSNNKQARSYFMLLSEITNTFLACQENALMKKWNMTDRHKEASAQWNWKDACLLITDEMIHIYIRRLQSRVQVFSMLKKLWKSNRSIRLFKILFRCTNLLIEKKNPGNKATFCVIWFRGTLRQWHI